MVSIMEWQTAISNHPELSTALASCIETLEMTLDDSPDVIFVFVSRHHQESWGLIGPVLQKRFAHVDVIGCCGGGIIGGGHEVERSPALSLAAACIPGVECRPFHFESTDYASDDLSDDDWRKIFGGASAPQALILLPDPYSTDIRPVIAAADRIYPDATVVGGMASGGREPGQHVLIHNGTSHKSGCVGIALSGNLVVSTVVAQGCRPIGPPLFATRVEGHTIYEIDGQPALDVLESVCKALPPEEIALAQQSLFIGLAMDTGRESYGKGDYLVRDVVGAMPEGRALVVAARPVEQGVIQFHIRDARSAWEDLDTLVEKAAKSERPSVGGLMFSCVGRGESLFGENGHDSRVIQQHMNDLPLAGFFGNGEIGPVGGRTWIHGYTTALALFRQASDA
jgi:small ligand-binding sensory domain FIST